MKTWVRTSLLAALAAGMVLPSAAIAGGNPDAMLALHVTPRVTKAVCSTALPTEGCSGFTTESSSPGFFSIFVCAAGIDSLGIAGAQFGVDYADGQSVGCDISAWYSCTDLQFEENNWPQAGTGNLVTWEPSLNCQNPTDLTSAVLIGVFDVTAYSGDVFTLTPRPVDGKAKVADCTAAENDITAADPSRLGVVTFGTTGGYNPCLSATVPVRPTTWGNIKQMYEN